MGISVADVVLPTDEASLKKIKSVFQTCSDSLIAIQSHRDLIKDEIDAISKEFEIPKKDLNKLMRIHHKQNFDQIASENERIEIMYERMLKT